MSLNFDEQRKKMVDSQLRSRNIVDGQVLTAMETIPRHFFVPEGLMDSAYSDRALPLGPDQTISQPYIVALMLQAADLKPQYRVLEIGTGSGYSTAVLSMLVSKVYSVELDAGLTDYARKRIERLQMDNISLKSGNGFEGWPEHAPYDAILVTAAPASIPRELLKELKPGGWMVLPFGGDVQELVRMKQTDAGLITEDLGGVRFVPMKS